MSTYEFSAGGMVYSYDEHGHLRLALILDRHGNWGLPKGHLDGDETAVQAAQREIEEEIGLPSTIGPLIQRIEYMVQKRGRWRPKMVDYFLARSNHADLTPDADDGIVEVRWVTPAEALDMVHYAQVRDVLRQGLALLGYDPEKPTSYDAPRRRSI